MSKNLCGKTRPIDQPYEVWRRGDWEWRVLKKYQSPEAEEKNPFARWFCGVRSPFTYGEFEFVDVYIKDIKNHAEMVVPTPACYVVSLC